MSKNGTNGRNFPTDIPVIKLIDVGFFPLYWPSGGVVNLNSQTKACFYAFDLQVVMGSEHSKSHCVLSIVWSQRLDKPCILMLSKHSPHTSHACENTS